MTREASKTRMLVTKGRRANLLLVRERNKKLIVHKGFRDKAMAIRAKVRSGLLAS